MCSQRSREFLVPIPQRSLLLIRSWRTLALFFVFCLVFYSTQHLLDTRGRLTQAETHRHRLTAGGLSGVSDPAGPHHPRQSVILLRFSDIKTEFLSLKNIISHQHWIPLELSTTLLLSCLFVCLLCLFLKHSSFGRECDFKIQDGTFAVVLMSRDSLLFCGRALMWRVPLPWRHHSSLRNWLHRLTYFLNWLPRSLSLSFSPSHLFNALFKHSPSQTPSWGHRHDNTTHHQKPILLSRLYRKYNSVGSSWILIIWEVLMMRKVFWSVLFFFSGSVADLKLVAIIPISSLARAASGWP